MSRILQNVDFPEGLSHNMKHWSNKTETIISSVHRESERRKGLPRNQK